jgi:hypothetical protein
MDFVTVQGRDIVGELLPFRYRTRSRERPVREVSVLESRGILSGALRTEDYLPFRGEISSGDRSLSDINPNPGNIPFGSIPTPAY